MNSEPNSESNGPVRAPVVLVVEDDPLTRRTVGRLLQMAGYEVIMVASAADALFVAQREVFHVLVLDLQLVDVDPFSGIHEGFAVLDWLRYQLGEFRFRIVIYTSQSGQHLIEKAQASGAFAFCTKRHDMSNLLQCVAEAVQSLQAA